MKLIVTLFRLLCALIVLLGVATYLDGSLQASLTEYMAAFTPEHVQAMADAHGWIACAAGALVLLALIRALKLTWNLAYSLATIAFFIEAAIMTIGPELALPTAARGYGWEETIRELIVSYPVPALMIPALCILGCFCSSAPVRIAWTSFICCALCYGCAELFHYLMLQWQAMPEPFLPQALELVQALPWVLVALPAVFFVQYCLFMAMFETFIPRKKKAAKLEAEKADASVKEEEKPVADTKTPAAATAAAATPVVVVKRPVIHKKSPVSPVTVKPKKAAEPETKAEEVPAESAEEKKEAPAEEAAPKADAPVEANEPKAEAAEVAATEEVPAEKAASEAPPADEAPAKCAIPSVPLPPKPVS